MGVNIHHRRTHKGFMKVMATGESWEGNRTRGLQLDVKTSMGGSLCGQFQMVGTQVVMSCDSLYFSEWLSFL